MRNWLLVDDDADDVEIFEIALQETGRQISLLKACDGEEALEFLRSTENTELPELVFLDINMPHMDGKRCLVEIRQQKFLNGLPVVMYSTTTDEKDIKECLSLGASEFVSKPADITALVGILSEYANQR